MVSPAVVVLLGSLGVKRRLETEDELSSHAERWGVCSPYFLRFIFPETWHY